MGSHRLAMNGRRQQAHTGSCASRPLLSSASPNTAVTMMREEMLRGGSRGEDGGVRQGGAAEAQRQEKEEAA